MGPRGAVCRPSVVWTRPGAHYLSFVLAIGKIIAGQMELVAIREAIHLGVANSKPGQTRLVAQLRQLVYERGIPSSTLKMMIANLIHMESRC
jgi:hypothetical protein